MTEARIVKTIFIRAARDRVWAFLTESELLARWFHATDGPLRAGQPYKLLNTETVPLCWGEVLEAEPPTRLVYSFTHDHLKGHETRVQWTLTPVGDGTMLEMIHDGFEGGDYDLLGMLFDHDKGWDDHFGRLRAQAGERDEAS